MKRYGEIFILDPEALTNLLKWNKEIEEQERTSEAKMPAKQKEPAPQEEAESSEKSDRGEERGIYLSPSQSLANLTRSKSLLFTSETSSELSERSETISTSFSYSSGSTDSIVNTGDTSESSDSAEDYWDVGEDENFAFLVPALLPESSREASELWANYGTDENFGECREYFRCFNFSWLPLHFFSQLALNLLHFSLPVSLWRKGFLGTCAGMYRRKDEGAGGRGRLGGRNLTFFRKARVYISSNFFNPHHPQINNYRKRKSRKSFEGFFCHHS
jgi:hypothetical protein